MAGVIQYIINDILSKMPYLRISLKIGLLAFLILPLYYRKFRNRKNTIRFFVGLYCFITYLSVVWHIVFLSREMGGSDRIDLLPFESWAYCSRDMIVIYVLENILLFVPIGFLLPLTFSCFQKLTRTIFLCFGFSVLIEVVQYCTGTGFMQTDDVLNNTIGAVVGYLIYTLLKKMHIFLLSCDHIDHGGGFCR